MILIIKLCPGAGEPGPDGEHGPVNVADFAAHVASLHADSDIGFSREYNEILRSVQSISQIWRFNQSGLLADFVAHVASLHANSDIGFSRDYDEILRSVQSIRQIRRFSNQVS